MAPDQTAIAAQEQLLPTFNHASAEPNAATRVFDIAELLEMILEHVSLPTDIMALRQASHGVRLIVDNSKRLKLRPPRPRFERCGYIYRSRPYLKSCPGGLPTYFHCLPSLSKQSEAQAVLYFNHDKRPPLRIHTCSNYNLDFPTSNHLTVIVSTTQSTPNLRKDQWTAEALLATDIIVGTVSSIHGLFIGDLYDSAEVMIARYEKAKAKYDMDDSFVGKPSIGWALWFVDEDREH